MALATVHADNRTTRFQQKLRREYVREGVFGPDIGNDEDSIIQTNKNLKKISIALIAKVKGAGVTGSAQLSGSEVALSNFAQTMTPTHYRQGVLVDNEENEKAEFDLFDEARPGLMNWAMELKRDQIIQALGSVEAGGVYYLYGGTGSGAHGAVAASAANLDTWNTNNKDRIIYGKLLSNYSAGNHTTSLGNIDTTDDKLTAAMVTLAKRRAKTANPLIRPYQVKKDQTEWYKMYVGSFGFRDLKNDSTITQANREARPRNVKDNPIFADGDLVYDGVIIKEVPAMDIFTDGGDSDNPYSANWGTGSADSLLTGGNTSSRVGVAFLCGVQAVAFVMGKNARFDRRKEDDYGHLNGVAVTMKHDIKKTFYNLKQHGMVTVFHSATADA